jgi:SPP1 gp7 family putative phage head morphogenesis protein
MKPLRNNVLKPLHPNVGIEMEYRRRLLKLIEAMHNSIEYWITSKYKNNEPVIAQDAVTPASSLRIALAKLVRRWQRRFDLAAKELAEYFTDDVSERTDERMKRILKDGGFSVKFTMTPAMQDIARATVNANVSLIKSIPQQYLRNVEGIVMRSVQSGRDLGQLSKDLQKQFGVTKRRAALISRDQNNKASSAFQRARQQELGITRAIWMHSHGGKEPRPTHVKMDGKSYDINKGMWDPAVKEFIFPGQLINCRCTSRSVVAGFS